MTAAGPHSDVPVEPHEVWALPFEGGLLYERLGAAWVERAQAEGLGEEAIDAVLARAVQQLDGQLQQRRVGPLVLSGGLSGRPGLARRLPSLPRLTPPACAGAFLAPPGVLLLDVGQSAAKRVQPGGREVERFVRPLAQLPLRLVEQRADESQRWARDREAFVAWVASLLGPGQGEALVVLPCELPAGGGEPGACSYGGLDGEALRRLAALRPMTFIHDAVWSGRAAWAAGHRNVWSVGLGFGPSAAWVGG